MRNQSKRGRPSNVKPEQIQGGQWGEPYQIEAAINRGNFTPSKGEPCGDSVSHIRNQGGELQQIRTLI